MLEIIEGDANEKVTNSVTNVKKMLLTFMSPSSADASVFNIDSVKNGVWSDLNSDWNITDFLIMQFLTILIFTLTRWSFQIQK